MKDIGILKDIDPFSQPSFSFKNRSGRLVWMVSCLLFFRYTPRQLNRMRIALLRLFGARIGRGCVVHSTVKIWAPWNLIMEDYSSMGWGVDCYSMATVHLGKYAVISQRSYLCTGTHDFEDPNFQLIAKPIVIGERAWVAAESFIGPGVIVGAGTVIGARSVVVKEMPEWMVCAGNPCKQIRPRIIRGSK
jgi:putative colanic acid biosynthesis acetyltransferase WcaF